MIVEYGIYFLTTVILSTIFAIAGLGSAVALVPTLNIIGLSFDIARVSGLFVNSISTITTSILNLKKQLFDMKFVAPLVISSVIFAFIGARVSLMVDVEVVKLIFGITLLIIASMILFWKKPQNHKLQDSKLVLIFAGSVGGLFSGFLGIGGGSIISPILLIFGYDMKRIAIGISFVIPFSSIVAFGSYASVIELDYILLAVVGVAALIGGMIGNYLLHFKISAQNIKKILAVALYIIAFKMLY
ncbi:MAG: sulfite exporter TauE/SafE family protein [Epsilonproteobacteria bacterium]|nr:MAG: sulfite exporter TauE/SafE family protein [Campylobacterota bacterium]